MSSTSTPAAPYLMRILFRGMQIDAEAGEGRVINLTVRADKQHGSAWRCLLQYLANAIYRAGDLLNPRDHKGLPRVVVRVMNSHTVDYGQANSPSFYIVNRLPVRLPNGDASYQTFFFYEGVENKKLGLLGSVSAGFGDYAANSFVSCRDSLDKCTGDVHVLPDDDELAADLPHSAAIRSCRAWRQGHGNKPAKVALDNAQQADR